MPSLPQLAVPKGSTVLVTGANGLLGSHIADQFLAYGYKVRGTVRDLEKSSWLADVFVKNYGKGSFVLVKVPDMAAKSAFDEAAKGRRLYVWHGLVALLIWHSRRLYLRSLSVYPDLRL
jgi:nucleoside-diphosphate-sugar epimerase